MKYKLPRQVLKHPNIYSIIERELDRIDEPLGCATKKNLIELKEITDAIIQNGLPSYFVLKKISDQIGYGLFLHPKSPPLKKGTIIGPYSGVLTIEPVDHEDDSAYAFGVLEELQLSEKEQKIFDPGRKYAAKRKYALNLDASKHGNFTRFINHCEDPNVEAVIMAVAKNKFGLDESAAEVIYMAKKTIRPGQQLLVCYEDDSKSYWDAHGSHPIVMTPQTYQIDGSLKLVSKAS